MLIDVIACIRAHLRTYGSHHADRGDELVCAMPNMTLADAQTRFSHIAAELAAAPHATAIRTGIAELAACENTAALIARADHDLVAAHCD